MEVSLAILGQSTKLNARQSVFAAKSPNLMSGTIPMVYVYCQYIFARHKIFLRISLAYVDKFFTVKTIKICNPTNPFLYSIRIYSGIGKLQKYSIRNLTIS